MELRRESSATGLSADASEGTRVQSEGSAPDNVGQIGADVEEKDKAGEDAPKKPSKLKELWAKVGLDKGTAMMMFKYVARLFNYVLTAVYSQHWTNTADSTQRLPPTDNRNSILPIPLRRRNLLHPWLPRPHHLSPLHRDHAPRQVPTKPLPQHDRHLHWLRHCIARHMVWCPSAQAHDSRRHCRRI